MVYSKNELKRMFLRVLNEIQYGKMNGYSNDLGGIVKAWMGEYWKIEMTDEDMQRTFEAIQELRVSGLIAQDASQNSDSFVVLTQKGKEVVDKQRDPDIHGLQLEQVVRNSDILSRCLEIFKGDEYEVAIFSVYKLVEEEVRNKAGLDPSDIGAPLMTKALHPDKGKLTIPSCQLPNEQEGVYNLFKGAIAFFKNPSSHRTVNYDNKVVAIEIIALAELLLEILSTAQPRP